MEIHQGTDNPPDALLQMSVRLGNEPDLIQGAGGNTSYKSDDLMWVKASGAELKEALAEQIFVPLHVRQLKDLDFSDIEPDLQPCIDTLRCQTGLRPSIETLLHVLMPGAYVAHVHALNTLTATLQPKLRSSLNEAMSGLNWNFVEYAKPGYELSGAVAAVIEPDDRNKIIILQNHGLIVGGDDVVDVERKIHEVESRLQSLMRAMPGSLMPPDQSLSAVCFDTDYRPVSSKLVQHLAFDESAITSLAQGSFFPDQVVFLGAGIAVLKPGESIRDATERHAVERGNPSFVVLLPGIGVAIAHDAGNAAFLALESVAQIALSIATTPIVTMTPSQESAVMHWEAERYRKSRAR